jgi:signal transduction histidine kinase
MARPFATAADWSDSERTALAEMAAVLAPHAETLSRCLVTRLRPHLNASLSPDMLVQVNTWLLSGMFEHLRAGTLAEMFEGTFQYDVALLEAQREVDPELRSTLRQLYTTIEISAALILERTHEVCSRHAQLPTMLSAYGRLALHLGGLLARAFYRVRSHELQQRLAHEAQLKHDAAGAARHAERRRLARELHDSVLQDLTAIKLRLEARTPGATPADTESLVGALMRVMEELRRVVDDLRPGDLSTVSLSAAIADHARILTYGKPMTLALDLAEGNLVAEWAKRDVYRVAQEAIANAVRHAAPARIAVRLSRHDGRTVLEVDDDGAGFDSGATHLGGGITGMRERAAALGADLQITSAPGHGTRVRLEIPTVATRSLPPE